MHGGSGACPVFVHRVKHVNGDSRGLLSVGETDDLSEHPSADRPVCLRLACAAHDREVVHLVLVLDDPQVVTAEVEVNAPVGEPVRLAPKLGEPLDHDVQIVADPEHLVGLGLPLVLVDHAHGVELDEPGVRR